MANPSLHYIGSNIGPRDNHAQCGAVWQGIIRQHTGEYRPPPAYNFGVCNTHGMFFTGRGWDMDSAANGPGANRGSRALCVLVGPDDVITDVCRAAINRWAHEAVEQHGLQWPLRPHSSYVATSCPGDKLRVVIDQINAGQVPDQPGGDDFTVGNMEDIAQWEKDTRVIITKDVLDSVGQWEQDTRAYVDKRIKESEARIIAAINAKQGTVTNGQTRVEKYARLSVAEHLHQLDNDMDATDANRELLLRQLNDAADARYEKLHKGLVWVLTTFVSLILLVCGTLLAVVVRT